MYVFIFWAAENGIVQLLSFPQQAFLKNKLKAFVTAGEGNKKAIYVPFWRCGIRNMRQSSYFFST